MTPGKTGPKLNYVSTNDPGDESEGSTTTTTYDPNGDPTWIFGVDPAQLGGDWSGVYEEYESKLEITEYGRFIKIYDPTFWELSIGFAFETRALCVSFFPWTFSFCFKRSQQS